MSSSCQCRAAVPAAYHSVCKQPRRLFYIGTAALQSGSQYLEHTPCHLFAVTMHLPMSGGPAGEEAVKVDPTEGMVYASVENGNRFQSKKLVGRTRQCSLCVGPGIVRSSVDLCDGESGA